MMFVLVAMFVGVSQVDIELHAGDAGFLPARNVKMIAAEFQLLQLALQLAASAPRSISAPMNMSPLMPLKMSR